MQQQQQQQPVHPTIRGLMDYYADGNPDFFVYSLKGVTITFDPPLVLEHLVMVFHCPQLEITSSDIKLSFKAEHNCYRPAKGATAVQLPKPKKDDNDNNDNMNQTKQLVVYFYRGASAEGQPLCTKLLQPLQSRAAYRKHTQEKLKVFNGGYCFYFFVRAHALFFRLPPTPPTPPPLESTPRKNKRWWRRLFFFMVAHARF